MTDVSKAIYSGDWELYPCKGKVTIQDFAHPKIVLTDAEALHVWRVLNCWVERNAEADEVCELLIERKRRKMGDWISVKDKLPEKDGFVLAAELSTGRYVTLMDYVASEKSFGRWAVKNCKQIFVDYTHYIAYWMPLPEFPEVK